MRIALVCGHFLPQMGYVEVHLARAFQSLNHEVKIFTSTEIPKYIKKFNITIDDDQFDVERLKPYFKLGQMVKVRSLDEKVALFQPDLIVMIGLGKLFPLPVLKRSYESKKIVLLANNEDSFEHTYGIKNIFKSLKNKILQKFFKNNIYKTAVKNVDVFYAYTPSAIPVVNKMLPKRLQTVFQEKCVQGHLGFDENKFFYNASLRDEIRNRLHLNPNHLLFITATRVTPFKQLEQIIDLIARLHLKNKNIKYLLAGFGNDAYAASLKNYIHAKNLPEAFITLPLIPHNELNDFFNAADFGFWPTHIITHYEAMGTGLPLLLPNKNNVKHLLKKGVTGYYFNKENQDETFLKAISEVEKFRSNRTQIATYNKANFGFQKVAKEILNSIEL